MIRYRQRRQETQRQHSARYGWSLIEMMLLITLITMLGVMGGQIIMLLMEADGKLASSSVIEMTAQRLEDQFREDVEMAINVQTVDGGLDLQLPDQHVVEYRNRDEDVLRSEMHDKFPVRETYRFSEHKIAFSVLGDVVEVRVSHNSDAALPTRVDVLANRIADALRVRACLGRRWRQNAQLEEIQ